MPGFGWKKAAYDQRDYSFNNLFRTLPAKKLPTTYEIPNFSSIPVKDQDGVGACVAFSGSTITDWYKTKDANAQVTTSPEFIYDEGRKQEGTYPADDGMDIRTGCQILQKLGAPLNSVCPWNMEVYNNIELCDSPPVLADAATRKIQSYASCFNVNMILNAISLNYPVWLGVPVYENWPMTTTTGIIPNAKGKNIGGHAIAAYAYDPKYVRFRNSWGGWGNNGDGFLPRSYISKFLFLNMADAWTVTDLVAG